MAKMFRSMLSILLISGKRKTRWSQGNLLLSKLSDTYLAQPVLAETLPPTTNNAERKKSQANPTYRK